MKKLILAILIFFAANITVNAQTPPLNKQQTIDYLKKEYSKINTKYFKNLTLDNKVLIFESKDGGTQRVNLTSLKLDIYDIRNVTEGRMEYYIGESPKSEFYISHFQLKSDAIRLKKALEHLIELVKAEKSTDPFDN